MTAPVLEDDCRIRFNEWRVKQRDVEKERSKLETKEREIVKLYDNILLMVHVHAGFFIVITSLVGLFKEPIATYWMYGIMLTVILIFIIEVIRPILSARTKMWGLKSNVEELIGKRKEIYESCINLLDNYVAIYLFASQNKDHEDSFVKELREHEIDILEDFKSEDSVLKTRKKFYTKYPIAVGISCVMYTITLLLFTLSKSDAQLVLLPAPLTIQGPLAQPEKDSLSSTIQGSLKSPRRSLVSPFQIGKPLKKLTTEVEVAPTVAAIRSTKRGKRDTKEALMSRRRRTNRSYRRQL